MGRDPCERDGNVDRLGDVVVGPQPECLDDVGALAPGRHHDHRQLGIGMCGAKPRQDFEPAHARHLDVQQDDVVLTGGDPCQRLVAIRRGSDEIALPLQVAGERIAIELVVVDNEKRALPRHFATAPRASRSSIFSSS